jgi:hypothetical protein
VRRQLDPPAAARLQRRIWRVQQVVWALMAILLAAGLLGFLGGGRFSRRSIAASDGTLRVDYERFLRRGNRTTLLIRVQPAQGAATSALGLRIARAYLDGMRVESVFPPPRRTQAGPDDVTLDFDADSPPGSLTLRIDVVPERLGAWQAAFRAGGGSSVGFRQWVYP